MIWFFYNLLFLIVMIALLPKHLWRMWKRGGYRRGFMQRFGCYGNRLPAPRKPGAGRIWIHAVSVGEMFIALRFLKLLREMFPEHDFVLTTNTSTGHALAAARVRPPDTLLYFPIDLPCIMRRVFRQLDPRLILLMECELWPNMLREAKHRKIPVAVINARLSDRSFAGYRKLRFLFRRATDKVHAIYAQTERDARRFRDLGMPRERVHTVGNAKYDLAVIDPRAAPLARAARDAAAIPPNALIVLGGSTWPGEEEKLMHMLPRLRQAVNEPVCLVLVPRHVERCPQILECAGRHHLKVVTRRDSQRTPATTPPDVLLVDTTGELQHLYAMATVIFVGKSLDAGGGQNPIEPAAHGRAVIVGPHMQNFKETVGDLLAAEAIVRVNNPSELEEQLVALLRDSGKREQLGKRAAAAVERYRGALRRTAQTLPAPRSRHPWRPSGR